MKHINFSLWWWFIYQWWIWVFIKYSIDNYNKIDNNYTKRYSKEIKELLDSFLSEDLFPKDFIDLNTKDIVENILEYLKHKFLVIHTF